MFLDISFYVFLTFYFVLGYSWLTMMQYFQVSSEGIRQYIGGRDS